MKSRAEIPPVEAKSWRNEVVSFLLSLGFGALGLLAIAEWREAMLVVVAKAGIYPLSIPVIDKVFLIFSGLYRVVVISQIILIIDD